MLTSPFEFIVLGLPVGLQAKSQRKNAWKARVLGAATAYWNQRSSPLVQSLQVTIVHYYATTTIGDTDNLVKPILDALNGLVYVDDSSVTDVICRRRRIDTTYDFDQVPYILLDGLTSGADDFIYVVVEAAPDATLLKP